MASYDAPPRPHLPTEDSEDKVSNNKSLWQRKLGTAPLNVDNTHLNLLIFGNFIQMEHLFFEADQESLELRVTSAYLSDILDDDWTIIKHDHRRLPHIQPTTPWLGFEHDPVTGQPEDRPPVQRNLYDYAKIRGWDMERAWNRYQLREAHPRFVDEQTDPSVVAHQVAAMLQSWLYFGLLEAVTGKMIHTSYLVRPDESGRPLIYSQNLAFCLQAWIEESRQQSSSEIKIILENARDNLLVAAANLTRIYEATDPDMGVREQIDENYPGFCKLLVMLTPAIVRLTDAVGVASERTIPDSDLRMMSYDAPREALDVRNMRLQGRGWCPFLLTYCEANLHVSVLDWLDGSGKTNASGGHADCAKSACVRNNIETETYQMQHYRDDCHCSIVKPDFDGIIDAIDRGHIPVFEVHQSPDAVGLTVSSRSSALPGDYIAISHVWVDGLGSTTEEGIFACQARRLGDLVARLSLYSGAPIWIDSVCIPSSPEHRRKAIGLLRNVYKNAAQVLVVDKIVQQCPKDMSAEDLAWSLLCSPWMQRLWTYQESYLAAKTVLTLSDSFFALFDSFQDFPESTLPDSIQVVRSSLVPLLRILRPDVSLQGDTQTSVGEVASAVNWRTTSKAGDEVLAIAALFNLDSQTLSRIAPTQRLREFFLMVEHLPHDIIFHDSTRMAEPPFRWAPTNLMSRSATMVDTTTKGQNAKCTKAGLICNYLILHLRQDQRGEDGLTWYIFEHTESSWYTIYWDSEYQNNTGSRFNALICRSVQEGFVLKPEVNIVREGVAVLTGKESPNGLMSQYAGRATMLRYSDEQRLLWPQDKEIIDAEWQEKDLCIT